MFQMFKIGGGGCRQSKTFTFFELVDAIEVILKLSFLN